ncbi:MAG: Ig-like domain-containing protein [Gemmatimonadetes bacterium]|nr:Ig-like domain-containing protein [Gemmatimonadota bacterium]
MAVLCHKKTALRIVTACRSVLVLVFLSLLVLSSCGKDGPTRPDGSPVSSPAPAPTPARISITPSSVSLTEIGETARLSATVYSNDSAVLSGAVLSWASSNANVAVVDNGGLVTAVSYGTAQVTARSGNASQSVQVTVIQEASRIVIEPAMATLMSLGQTLQMTAAVFDKNEQPVKDAEVAWQSSSEGVATVDDGGLVTAVSNGTALISARSGSASQTVQVTVMQEAGRIVIEPYMVTLFRFGFGERSPRKTVKLSATVLDANGRELEDAEVKWSSNKGIVTVDEGGLVTAVSDGTAEITARSGDASASVAVRVLLPVIIESSLPLDHSRGIPILRLDTEGQTAQLSAIVYDVNGQEVEGAPVEWEHVEDCFICVGTNVVTVDENGLVTARTNGETIVNVTASDFHWSNFSSLQVSVNIIPSGGAHIRVYPPHLHLGIGMMVQLSTSMYDEDGQVVEDTEFAWSSDDNTVATVDADGLVTAEAYGMARITAQADELSASISLIVSARSDRARLISFYHATDGENWRDSAFNNWLSTAPIADWDGVKLNEAGRVRSLLRGTQNLTGTIPPVLAQLSELRVLQLFRNALTGSIPPELGQLAYLEELYLGTNQLTGGIPPELGQLENLEILDLWQNQLSGNVPPELGQLANLEVLDLSRNADLSGPLPEEMLNLTKLDALSIGSTQLCVPKTDRFDEWLAGIRVKLGVSRCGAP